MRKNTTTLRYTRSVGGPNNRETHNEDDCLATLGASKTQATEPQSHKAFKEKREKRGVAGYFLMPDGRNRFADPILREGIPWVPCSHAHALMLSQETTRGQQTQT